MATFTANVRVVDKDGDPKSGVFVMGRHGLAAGDGEYTDDDGWVELEFDTVMNTPLSVTFYIGKYGQEEGPHILEPDEEESFSFVLDD